jgi:DNA transformation protein
VLELLAPIDGIATGRMFGGVSIYHDGAIFGYLDRHSTLYFKVDDSNRAAYTAAGSSPLASDRATMPYYTVPSEVIEDPAVCVEWARAAIAAGHATAAKRPATRRRS